jgi:alginate O-acetyltransferase complex protein AlgI
MNFNSSIFLLYFLPLFLILYFILSRELKNWLLLLTSVFFYAWGAPKFVFFMAGALLADFFIVGVMNNKEGKSRRLLLWLSVVLNLGLLLWFKYMNFFVDQVDTILNGLGLQSVGWTRIALPVGISFITFQKLAYTLDVFKRHFKPFERLQDFALYIFMFPQLLSGPIVRPGQLSGQIWNRAENDNLNLKITGFYRFVIGLAKKVIIADTLAFQVNEIFALDPFQLSSALAWIGAIAYTFQIYFDFSGYTDMAIGLARMLGFRLPENFRNPYISGSITEFWRRWHITLSFWFRDYVFLPLAFATSRKLPKEKYLGLRADKMIYLIAVLVTFLLCGFWHGAAWTFILWGAYQGLFLILDRMFLLRLLKKTGKLIPVMLTFAFTAVGWVLFRSGTIHDGLGFIGKMFSFRSGDNDVWLNPKFWTMFAIAALISFTGLIKGAEARQEQFYLEPGNKILLIMALPVLILLVLSVATITGAGFSPFIYFRF